MQTCQVSFTQSTVEGAAWGLLQSLRFTRIVKGNMPAVLCPVGDSQGLEVTGATLACIPMGLKWEHRSGWGFHEAKAAWSLQKGGGGGGWECREKSVLIQTDRPPPLGSFPYLERPVWMSVLNISGQSRVQAPGFCLARPFPLPTTVINTSDKWPDVLEH